LDFGEGGGYGGIGINWVIVGGFVSLFGVVIFVREMVE
jgi:hypothetical protein